MPAIVQVVLKATSVVWRKQRRGASRAAHDISLLAYQMGQAGATA
jgi:hypothetical protein